MQFFICAFFLTLILNIHLYNFFICLLPNGINVITFGPKITTPQLCFNFWMKTKQFFCRNAFYCLNNTFYRQHRNTLYQKMNMIFIRTYFQQNVFHTVPKFAYRFQPNFVQQPQTKHFSDILSDKLYDTATNFYYRVYEYVHS